jgi:hypothetical protein
MADVTIGGIGTSVTAPLTGAELLEFEQSATTKKGTVRNVAQYVGTGLNNQQFATQSPAANATTYLTGSNILIPAGETARTTTWFRWKMVVSKTGAGTATKSILLKIGTAGTTSDATILTFTYGIGTAVIDQGDIEIVVGFRTVGSTTTATVFGTSVAKHNLATTGLFTTQFVYVMPAVSSGFDSTVSALQVGLAFTAGVSEAWTFAHLTAEAINL